MVLVSGHRHQEPPTDHSVLLVRQVVSTHHLISRQMAVSDVGQACGRLQSEHRTAASVSHASRGRFLCLSLQACQRVLAVYQEGGAL